MKRIKVIPALLTLVVTAAVILVLGQMRVRQAAASFRTEDAAMPGHATERLLDQLRSGDYHALYEATMAIQPSMDAENAYTDMVGSIIEKWGSDTLSVQCSAGACGLYAGDEYLADIVLQETGSGWQAGLPLAGDRTAVVEVPVLLLGLERQGFVEPLEDPGPLERLEVPLPHAHEHGASRHEAPTPSPPS